VSPLDAAIVRRKLRRIRANLESLTRITAGLDAAHYHDDEVRRRAVERLLQETIDAAVDANNYLLRAAGDAPAEDYFSSFVELGEAGIIDAAVARALAPAAGLRNRIVHQYEDLDDSQVLSAAQEAPAQFREYVGAVERYLAEQGL